MLSFVLPVYKPKDNVLTACIKSLKYQSLKDCEYLFVLDGMDGDALRIIKRETKNMGKVRIMVKDHGGAPSARNHGKKRARGKYIVFFDSDSQIEPDAAKAWVDIMDNQKDIDFVYSGYKFTKENGGYDSEEFDPWLLRCRNYISSCFPVRMSLCPDWDDSLESLQDWDFWLTVVEGGSKGKFLPGYAFSTPLPDPESISGKGCTDKEWLNRLNAVKKKHKIKDKKVCVTSLAQKHEGIRLAKLINADYVHTPHQWPHTYKTIVQVGYNLFTGYVEAHTAVFRGVKNRIIFWTSEDINIVMNQISLRSLKGDRYNKGYVDLLNNTSKQYVEDKEAKWLMERAGFKVQVMPLPMLNEGKPEPLPKKPVFVVDIQDVYGHNFVQIERCLPDVDLRVIEGPAEIKDFTGLIHFHTDRSISPMVKRAILAGRHVVSNIQAPLANFVDDKVDPDDFVPAIVNKIRSLIGTEPDKELKKYYQKTISSDKLMEVV